MKIKPATYRLRWQADQTRYKSDLSFHFHYFTPASRGRNCFHGTILFIGSNIKQKNYNIGGKRKKMLLVLAIVGMFVIPMMPATKAATILQKGDIAICEGGPFDWIVRWYASNYWNKQVTWTHAACYVGSTSYSSSTVVETAKHGIYIIADVTTVSGEQSSHDSGKWIRISCDLSIRESAANWLKDRTYTLGGEWHPYDYVSLTKSVSDHKQVDEQENSARGGKYYCSELVWAAYRYYGFNIDKDKDETSVVWPDDIYGLINMGQATIVTSWQNQ